MTRPVTTSLVALAILAIFGVLLTRLALAPIHGAHDAEACRRALASARTHADTLSADMMSFPDTNAGRMRRRKACGELRIATGHLPTP